jgi:signal transduction histidine kinase
MPDHPLRVMVVDDEPSGLEVIGGLLATEPYELTFAASGPEALERVKRQVPDVVITDLMMPGMDGLALVTLLRAREKTKATPVIVVTALDTREDVARALDAGATDFLSKPVSGTELRARVRSMARIARGYDAMREMLALRTKLTNMLVHDLRSPIQGLSFALEELARGSNGGGSAAALGRARGQAVRLRDLVDDLLVTAKSEAGRLVLSRMPVAAEALFAQAADDVREHARARGVHVATHAAPELRLFADLALFRRTLCNLLDNAIRLSPPGTTVELTAAGVDGTVDLYVMDEGPGVAESERGTIFDSYVTAEGEASARARIGLGLSFCKMVAEAHGGSIEVLPRAGGGSMFHILIPEGL